MIKLEMLVILEERVDKRHYSAGNLGKNKEQ